MANPSTPLQRTSSNLGENDGKSASKSLSGFFGLGSGQEPKPGDLLKQARNAMGPGGKHSEHGHGHQGHGHHHVDHIDPNDPKGMIFDDPHHQHKHEQHHQHKHSHHSHHHHHHHNGPRAAVRIMPNMGRVEQGCLMKHFQYADHFEILFQIMVEEVPIDENNIFHVTLGQGSNDSRLPYVSLKPGTSNLQVHFRHEDIVDVTLVSQNALPLNETVSVTIRMSHGFLVLEVGGIPEAKSSCAAIEIAPEVVQVYCSSPFTEAAVVSVGRLIFKPEQQKSLEGRERSNISFEMPPKEKSLLEDMTAEIARNAKWAKFDSFFGCFLCLNSILLGVQSHYWELEDEKFWNTVNALDVGFLVIFTIEFLLRLYVMGKRFYKDIWSDGWALFDACVISISILEATVLQSVKLPFPIGVLRLFRLLKLAKMVRLVRAFRRLGMLVEGLIQAMSTLVWSGLLMSILLYVGSVMTVKLANWAKEAKVDDADALAYLNRWSGVHVGMVHLFSIATCDGWTEYVREMAFYIGGTHGTVIALVLLIFLTVSAFGIMNLIIGVLCHTAFELDRKNKRMKGAELLLVQRDHLFQYRKLLKGYGERPLFRNDRFIHFHEVFEGIEEDPDIKKCMEVLEFEAQDMMELVRAFAEGGEVEIDGMMEAMVIVILQRYFGTVATDFTGKSTMGAVRPIDMLFFSRGLLEMNEAVKAATGSVHAVQTLCYDCIRVLCERAHTARTMFRISEPKHVQLPRSAVDEENLIGASKIGVEVLEKYVDQVQAAVLESQIAMPMDIFFGVFIIANGAFMGLRTYVEADVPFFIVEIVFIVIFIVEFWLRAILYADLKDVHETSLSHSFVRVHKKLMWGIFPRCPDGGCKEVMKHFPMFCYDVWVFFDIVVIVVSLLDTIVLSQLRRLGLADLDLKIMGLLRIMRLIRLVKLLRVFKLFPKLQLIVACLGMSVRTIFWTMILLLTGFHMFVVLFVSALGKEVMNKPNFRYYFGNSSRLFLTCWQILTFDDWDDILRPLLDAYPACLPFVVGFLVVLSIGMMNMVVGIFCESALMLMVSEEEERQRKDMVNFLSCMAMVREFVELNTPDMKLTVDMVNAYFDFVDDVELDEPVPDWWTEMNAKLEQSGFVPEMVKQIFQKLDYESKGAVRIDQFIQGAVEMKEDLAKLDIFASSLSLRHARQLRANASIALFKLHGEFSRLVWKMAIMILRQPYDPIQEMLFDPMSGFAGKSYDPFQSASLNRDGTATDHHLNGLDESAAAALQLLCEWNCQGSLPEHKGSLQIWEGEGKVVGGSDVIMGQDSKFRKDLKPGDMILVEKEEVDGKGASNMDCASVFVKSVVSNTTVRIDGQLKVQGWHHYKIARWVQEDNMGLETKDAFTNLAVGIAPRASPRTNQTFFEWDIHSKKKRMRNMADQKRENEFLLEEFEKLAHELHQWQYKDLAATFFQAWKRELGFLDNGMRIGSKSTPTKPTGAAMAKRLSRMSANQNGTQEGAGGATLNGSPAIKIPDSNGTNGSSREKKTAAFSNLMTPVGKD